MKIILRSLFTLAFLFIAFVIVILIGEFGYSDVRVMYRKIFNQTHCNQPLPEGFRIASNGNRYVGIVEPSYAGKYISKIHYMTTLFDPVDTFLDSCDCKEFVWLYIEEKREERENRNQFK